MPNKLADQSSPYLLQHKDNPVDWYPWSDEAFRAAKARNVPVLVSIGYSTCHWCHVMAHESFEDAAVAQLLNDSFVCIKVDREERPDIDAIYLQSMQALGYHTGWPLNVWLTPDGLPFYGGTYFPPTSRQGMPSFTQAILTIRDLWQRDRAKVVKGGQEVAKHVIQAADAAGYPETINHDTMQNCLRALFHEFDKQHGGFGKAPKFPHQTSLEFLLRHYRRTNDVAALSMVELTLGAMAEGGIHDQLGGGFSRYSVDEEWHVPHFEKMLYDNALLLPLYVDTYRLTGESFFLQAAEGIVRWLRTDMLLHNGAFAAATDADSEGVEGKFYIWTAAEIDTLLSTEDADLIKLHFGVADPGSFEGANVLGIVKTDEDLVEDLNLPIAQVRERLQRAKEIMLDARKHRVAPHRDDKIIAGWNGLAIHALAYSGAALNRPAWIRLARNAAQFVTANMIDVDGTMSRSWANGMSTANGVLEDYANVARGLLTLYGVTGEAKWADIAWNLVEVTRERFTHASGVGFYDTPASTDLFARPREFTDTAVPSGNAVMAEVLAIFSVMRRDDTLRAQALEIVEAMGGVLARYPLHTGMLSCVAERLIAPTRELVLVGHSTTELRDAGNELVDPLVVRGYVHTEKGSDWAMTEDKPFTPETTAYWCTNYTCKAPSRSADALREAMSS